MLSDVVIKHPRSQEVSMFCGRSYVLHGEGRISAAPPTKQNNDQPCTGQPQEAV